MGHFRPNRREVFLSGVAWSLSGLRVAASTSRAWSSTNRTRRGLNILQPNGFILADRRGYPRRPYSFQGFEDDLPPLRLQAVASAGFDFVRMPVDFGPMLAGDDGMQDVRIADLLAQVRAYVAAGFGVIFVMFSAGDQTTGWGAEDILDGTNGPKFRRLNSVWARVAHALSATDPDKVALELFNEPPAPDDIKGDPWSRQQESLFRTIRVAAPTHTIIATADDFSSIDRLATLDPTKFDANTMFRIDGYEPFQISHQGDEYYEYIRRLTFPPRDHPGGKVKAIKDISAEIEADPSLSLLQKAVKIASFTREGKAEGIDTYFDIPCDEAFIAAKVGAAVEWAETHGIAMHRILVGEFGARGDFISDAGAKPRLELAGTLATRAGFVRAWREKIEAANLGGWCVHEISGPDGFSIAAPTYPWGFQTEMLAALDLAKPTVERPSEPAGQQ